MTIVCVHLLDAVGSTWAGILEVQVNVGRDYGVQAHQLASAVNSAYSVLPCVAEP
eukprot:SAG25_NODE_6661_length_540_cov_1.145125_1_plen_55_part_00